MTGAPTLVRRDDSNGVAVLTIDHPPVNVLSREVLDGLLARFEEVRGDPIARVVLLEGAAEKAFAAGANIREMAPMGPAEAFLHGQKGQAVTRAIEELPLPVIAAVHGSCLGGGTEIALACDLIVASDDARFGQPEIDLGVMPGWGGTQRLPRRIGAARAREWILTGRPVPAAEALELGLLVRVVPRAMLHTTAMALAAELAGKSSTALAAAKRALRGGIDRGLERGLEEELELWKELFGTADQREGMAAFLEKRRWTPASRRAAPRVDPSSERP